MFLISDNSINVLKAYSFFNVLEKLESFQSDVQYTL